MHSEAFPLPVAARIRAWGSIWSDWASGRRGRWRQAVLWTLALLIVLRMAAPWVLTRLANDALADGEKVRGSISGLSLGLLTCDYTVHDLELRSRRDDDRWQPLLRIERLHCDLTWGPLLRGELAGVVNVHQPELQIYSEEPPSLEEVPVPLARPARTPAAPPWQDALRTVVRVNLTAINIFDGRIRYHDERREIETGIDHIAAQVGNLAIPEPAITHRSPFQLTAITPGHGALRVDGEADVLAKAPTFLVRAQVEEVALPELSPLTRKLGNLSFADGTFTGYAEVVADGRRLGGYLKVLFHRLDIDAFAESEPGAGTPLFWGLMVEAAEDILENPGLKQHAARLPIRGELVDPDTDVWTALGTALRNAFIRAMVPGFERQSRQ
jgi:hypothetical protein